MREKAQAATLEAIRETTERRVRLAHHLNMELTLGLEMVDALVEILNKRDDAKIEIENLRRELEDRENESADDFDILELYDALDDDPDAFVFKSTRADEDHDKRMQARALWIERHEDQRKAREAISTAANASLERLNHPDPALGGTGIIGLLGHPIGILMISTAIFILLLLALGVAAAVQWEPIQPLINWIGGSQ